MTRKDYNLIAKVLQDSPWTMTCAEIATRLSTAFGEDNKNFNKEKFLDAALKDC